MQMDNPISRVSSNWDERPASFKSGEQGSYEEAKLKVEVSGLFDSAWYLTQYPDVLESRIDPVEHYLCYGAAEGRSPGPNFDSAWYLAQNPDVAAAELNPLLHYLCQGAREGRRPCDPLLISLRQTAARSLASLSRLEPELLVNFDTLPVRDGQAQGPVYETLKALFESFDSSYERIIFAPRLTGEASWKAANALLAAMERHGAESTLLVITDSDRVETEDLLLPEAAAVRVFSEYTPDLSLECRSRLVTHLVHGLKPRSIMNVASRACWDAMKSSGRALSTFTDLYAMVCHSPESTDRPTGHLDRNLRTCLPFLKGVYVDHVAIAKQLTRSLGIPPCLSERITVVRQPASTRANPEQLSQLTSGDRICLFLTDSLNSKDQVDLLIKIVTSLKHLRIDVYYAGDVTNEFKLAESTSTLDNIMLLGSIEALERSWMKTSVAFVFVSIRRDLPHVLVRAAALGIPIVASDVGGTRELVDEETGWLIKEPSNPAAYSAAVEEIRSNHSEVKLRTRRMLSRIENLHSWHAYVTSLSIFPSFLAS